MEALASSVLKSLGLVKADLQLLLQNGIQSNVSQSNLHYAIKLFKDIAKNLQNELQTCVNGRVLDRGASHCLNLLKLELTYSSPNWMVYKQKPASLTLIRICEENGRLLFANHVVIEILQESSKMVSIRLKQQRENIDLRLQIGREIFVTHVVFLLKAFLPSSVVIFKRNVLFGVKTEIVSLESDSCGKHLSSTVNPGAVSVVKVEPVDHPFLDSVSCESDDSNRETHGDLTNVGGGELSVSDDESHMYVHHVEKASVQDNIRPLYEGISLPNSTGSESKKDLQVNGSKDRSSRRLERRAKVLKKFPLSCHLCRKAMSSFAGAARHATKEHGLKGFACCLCSSRIFNSKKDLFAHFHVYHHPKKNLTKRTLPCKDCKIPLGRNQALDHMQIEHGQPHACPFCDFKASNMDLSNINHLLIDCATTDGQSDGEMTTRLKCHILAAHRLEDPKIWQCGCKKIFPTKELLREHGNRTIAESERKTEVCKLIAARSEKGVCGHCGLSFVKHYLAKHAAKEHGVNIEERLKFACKYCSKRFDEATLLKSHLISDHFPEKKDFVCGICKKTFGLQRHLNYHMQRHSSGTFRCPKCPKVFKSLSNIRQHLMGCHHPPGFQCLICEKKYHHRAMLITHLKNAHGIADSDTAEHILKTKIDLRDDIALVWKLRDRVIEAND